IILDQFEGFFAYRDHQPKRWDAFARVVADAINTPRLRVHFLISIREDALAKLDYFRHLIPNVFENHVRIDHLDAAGARDAIVLPLETFNREHPHLDQPIAVEPALVGAVLIGIEQNRGDPAIDGLARRRLSVPPRPFRVEAPLLQMVMSRLWDEESQRGSH